MYKYKAFGLQILESIEPQFPNPALAVEGAEVLSSLPLQIQNNGLDMYKNPKISYENYKIWEKSLPNFTGQKLNMSDMVGSTWNLGEVVANP